MPRRKHRRTIPRIRGSMDAESSGSYSAVVRTLERAAQTIGSVADLARHLKVSLADLQRWIEGAVVPPQEIFVKALDVVAAGPFANSSKQGRSQTEADRLQNAADRIQAGADRIQASADRSQQNAGRAQASADRAQSEADYERIVKDAGGRPPASPAKPSEAAGESRPDNAGKRARSSRKKQPSSSGS